VKTQRYCSRAECQKARRKVWQQQKLEKDEDYRRNQADAQRRWRERHPEYWRRYRESHPDYVRRNRELQGQRDLRRRKITAEPEQGSEALAKMDSFCPSNPIESGTYKITPLDAGGLAKMDAFTVRLALISPEQG
jgi:hypothetical protein